ncbi:MAG: trypsin-like serine protease [Planctomycetaceae bacterium]|jgi:hypothetical protein
MFGRRTVNLVGLQSRKGDAVKTSFDRVVRHWNSGWSRRAAWVLVLVSVSLGLEGAVVGIPTSEAQAGIVVSDDQDPLALALGRERSGFFRGPGQGGSLSVYVTYDGVNGRETTFGGTAAAFNQYGAIATGHQFSRFVGKNLSIALGDGPNYLTDPGTLHNISELFIYPGYTDEASRITNPDVAVLRYASPVRQNVQMVIADSRPLPDAPLNWAGFGRPGSIFGGYLPADGAARAGNSYVGTYGPLEGESDYLYVQTTMFLVSGDLRPANGDSGSPIYNQEGQLLGVYTRAGTSQFSPYGLYADLTRPELREFVDEHLSVAAPEPSTLVMGAIWAGLCFFATRRSQKRDQRCRV